MVARLTQTIRQKAESTFVCKVLHQKLPSNLLPSYSRLLPPAPASCLPLLPPASASCSHALAAGNSIMNFAPRG